MNQMQLTSSVRTGTGKSVTRKLRREGLIPAVLYGGAHGNIALSVNSHELSQFIAKGLGENTLLNLIIQKEDESPAVSVILKDFQFDPVTRALLHADFLEVTMGQVIEINVPLELIGEAKGVKEGGILEFTTREVTIECLPSKMLDHIDVDISSLDIGDSLTVNELHLSEEHKLITSGDVPIATVAPPVSEESLEASEEGPVEPEVIQKGKKPEEE